jgi:competence ComEA-like helix-hairpin-helix protein
MTDAAAHKPIRGIGLMSALIAIAIGWAAWNAWHKSVLLTDSGPAIPASSDQSVPDMRIDINSATMAELSLRPGIGPALAQRVIDDRQANGPFASVDDLNRVKGIGNATIEKIRPFAVAEVR